MRRLLAPLLHGFLRVLDLLYSLVRKRVPPQYPYDRQNRRIDLPKDVGVSLRKQVRSGDAPGAVKRVAGLTGAGLRMSKDYVDWLRKQ
jgi:hypothetical protein